MPILAVPKTPTPTTPAFVAMVQHLTGPYINSRSKNQIERLYRAVGGTYSTELTVPASKAEFNAILQTMHMRLATPNLTISQQIGAIISSTRHHLLPLGRFEGFSDGLGDLPYRDYEDHLAGIGIPGAAGMDIPDGGIGVPGGGIGVPGDIGAPGAGAAVPPVPVPAVVGATKLAVPNFSARELMLEHTAVANFVNDAILTNLNFQPGIVPPELTEFEREFLKDCSFETLKLNSILLIIQFVPPHPFPVMGFEILLQKSMKAYALVSLTATTVKLVLIGFIGSPNAVLNPEMFLATPDTLELQRSALRGFVMVVKEGFLKTGLLNRRKEASKRMESATVTGGKFIITLDDITIPVVSNSHKNDDTVALSTSCTRTLSMDLRLFFCATGAWASVDWEAKIIMKLERIQSEVTSVSVNATFSQEYLTSFREHSHLSIATDVSQAVAFIKNQVLPHYSEFSGVFDKELTMQTGRQIAVTMLRNFTHWVVVQLGEQWLNCCQPLINELQSASPPESSFAHPQHPLEYFFVTFQDFAGQVFKMFAYERPQSFEKFNSGRVVSFDAPQIAPEIFGKVFTDGVTFKAQSAMSIKYMLNSFAVKSKSIPGSIKAPVKRSPAPNALSTRSRSNSSTSSGSASSVIARSTKKTNIKRVKFENTKTTQRNKVKGRGVCHKNFMYKIGAKFADGTPCTPCTGNCPFEHDTVPSDKKERLALAKKYFQAKFLAGYLERAKEALN